MPKRFVFSLALFIFCIVLLSGRLYYIQIICGDTLGESAEDQQIIPVLHGYSRGNIYDRNMEKLTETSGAYYYLVHRDACTEEFYRLMELSEGQVVGTKGEEYLVYRTKNFQTTLNLLLKENCGVYGFYSLSRYDDDQIAPHLIGYLNEADGTGSCGLEKMYEERLREDNPNAVLLGNGNGDLVQGEGLTEIDNKAALVCTLDKGLQSSIETVFKEKQITGAAVVMECQSGQILAMVSSPSFNPNQLQMYLDSEGSELVNKATQGEYPPGSVFKIAVAAAALEADSQLENYVYRCEGKETVHGVSLCCEGRENGHGSVDMAKAFAKSCNCYFAKLAEKTGSECIMDMAVKMGLGKTVWENFPDEASGNLPAYEERAYSGLSNFSIGQGSLLVTPVQVCQMTNLIANGGVYVRPELIMSQKAETQQCEQMISEETIETLKDMMQGVMTDGTGAGTEFAISVAGKTGSAETVMGGQSVVHGWFTGFFPADQPKYTAVVLVENGKTGRSSALPVFKDIVDYLY